SVNASGVDFTVAEGKIHFAMSAIKGCGGGAAEAIVKAREFGGPFTDIFDFCERVDPSQCNRAAIETLVKAGALDQLGGNRAQHLAVLDRALQSGAAAAADRRSGQMSLFGEAEEEPLPAAASLPAIDDLPERERLLGEKEVLGFYLTSHPLAEHQETLETFCQHTTATLDGLPDRAEVTLGGMLSSLKFSHTKNPKPGKPSKYVMFDLEDMHGAIRCIVWPDDFARVGELVQPDAILLARGALDRRGGDEANLIVNELVPIDQLDKRFTQGILIRLDQPHSKRETLSTLREILRAYPGECELQLLLTLEDGQRIKVKSESLRIDVDAEMRHRVDELLGPGNLKLLTGAAR
ncbi:MAG: DNA polymerase III subunit alpha, partial [Planctomycetales bacterium]|nr:DNA polymerase III subunit alpha [Planctomycetales bacterium]